MTSHPKKTCVAPTGRGRSRTNLPILASIAACHPVDLSSIGDLPADKVCEDSHGYVRIVIAEEDVLVVAGGAIRYQHDRLITLRSAF